MKPLAVNQLARSKEAPPDAEVFKALGNARRYHIMGILGDREATAKELAEMLEEPLNRICDSVDWLHDHDFIEIVDRDERRGGKQKIYKAKRRPVLLAEDWGRLPRVMRESVTASILRQLGQEVLASIDEDRFEAQPHYVLHRMPLTVDKEGMRELDEEALRHLDEKEAIQVRSDARRRVSGEAAISVISGTLAFEAAPVLPRY